MTDSIGTFRVLDQDDLTKVLFDCDDEAGTTGIFNGVKTQVRDLRVNAPELEVVRFGPISAPGARTVRSIDRLASMSWRQMISGRPVDDLSQAVGRLSQLIRDGGVIELLLTNGTVTKYADFEPSAAAALLLEERDVFHATMLNNYPEGIPIAVEIQPGLRSAELDPAVNLAVNPFFLWDTQAPTGTPDNWTWDNTTNITNQTIDAARNGFRFDIATTANRSLQQTSAAASVAPGDIMPFSFYATAISGTTARARVVIEYLNAASGVLATHTGSLVSLTSIEQRVTLVPPAAPATTDKVRYSIQMADSDAASNTVLIRLGQLEKAAAVSMFRAPTQTVQNDPAGATGAIYPVWNNGDRPCPGILTVKSPDASPKIQQILAAMRADGPIPGARRLPDYLNTRKLFQCESGTLSGDTSSVADAAASGGNVAQTSYASNPTVMAKRVRMNPTTLLDALRGYWDVYVRVKATAAAKHVLQLRSGPSSADPAPYSSKEVVHDTTGATSFGYGMKRLGAFFVPEEYAVTLAGLAFELWSRRDSGTGSLNWDYIAFVSTDPELMATIVFVAGGSSESWLGKDLVTPTNPAGLSAGSVSGNDLILDAVNEAGGTPPVGGLAWPAGHHLVQFKINGIIPGISTRSFDLRVRNITDSNNAVTKSYSGNEPDVLTLEFDSVGGKSYEPQGVLTATTNGGSLIMKQALHQFSPSLGQNEQARMDPGRRSGPAVEKLDSNGKLVQYLSVKGGVLGWFEPGLTLVYLNVGDVPLAGYSEPEDVFARTVVASYTHAPRWSQP
jgi:hypothetical protein